MLLLGRGCRGILCSTRPQGILSSKARRRTSITMGRRLNEEDSGEEIFGGGRRLAGEDMEREFDDGGMTTEGWQSENDGRTGYSEFCWHECLNEPARSKIPTESVSCILVTIQATCLMYYARWERRIDSAGYDRWSLAMRTLIVSPEIIFPTERSSTTLGSTHKILLLEVDIFVVSPQIC